MAYSKAQMEATNRYRSKAYDVIQITVRKGQRDDYRAQAAAHGLSLNAYIISLLEADRSSMSADPAALEVPTPASSVPDLPPAVSALPPE